MTLEIIGELNQIHNTSLIQLTFVTIQNYDVRKLFEIAW